MSRGIKSYEEKERRKRRRENRERRDVWKNRPQSDYWPDNIQEKDDE